MTALKKLDEFVRSGVVKRQSPDPERARSLLKESEDQEAFFHKVLGLMPFEEAIRIL